ncbi:PREDICTED: uncharacterized protein LOC104823937 isoform X2 [Tarenaya hassleriana]|uniref:uncharacterized protein LOC104823937 isoform X2 n=1 Tax=Tarenaya hassleriana TaxID=28532 RepID=UPI00053C183A|nr:PREDICTED: uncharacterized protein LOC104823937 isoform X2 [Tarenaya hassleriana]
MLGAGFQLTRGRRADDSVYSSARARRSHQNSPRVEQLRRAQSDVSNGRSTNPKENPTDFLNMERENGSGSLKPVSHLASESATSPSSNLERFLESVTPMVPAQYPSKTSLGQRRTCDVKLQPYFVLGDVWESFAEWSAYGTGVPLILNNRDPVVQYYVPSLSGIQIYADPQALSASLKSRRPGEESDSDFRDSSSDGSSDSESEQGICYHMEQISVRMGRISLRDQHQEDSSSDDGESLSQGRMIFEYLERDLPYIREPLADKISDLASQFPELKSLRSCDLLPSSWFSVAWYPIYRIPTGPTLKDLDACFLTYHSLHTPVGGSGIAQALKLSDTEIEKIPLPVFGLASYKFRGSLWTPSGGSEHRLANSLFQAADEWLRLHQVNQPDFMFFCRR